MMKLVERSGATLYERTYGRPYRRTTHSLASDMRDLLARGRFSDRDAWRYVIGQAIDTYTSRLNWGSVDDAAATFAEQPPLSGHSGLDAAVAALAEFLAHRDGWSVPQWVQSSARFAPEPWIVASLPSTRVRATRETPVEFGRRGVYVSPDDLVRV